MEDTNTQTARLQRKTSTLLLSALCLLLSGAAAHAAPIVDVGAASGAAGATVTLPVSFDPTTSLVAGIQFDLTLPANLTPGTVTPGATVTAAGKSVSTTITGTTWKFIIFGLNQNTVASGTLLTAQLVISSGTTPGALNIAIANTVYSDATGNAIAGGTSSGGTVTVLPNAPVITSTGTASGQVGVAFSYQIVATNSPTSYSASALPAGLAINATSGLISGTPTTAATSNITLTATNAGGSDTQALALTIKPATPVITSTGTASGQVGIAFSYQIVATNSPTSFGATGLPAGLAINTTTGLISGTPTTAATSNITLSATNAGGTDTQLLALTIKVASPVITSTGAASGLVGTAFSYQIVATNSPTSFNATGLPAGLTINATTGLISGTPTTAATSNITLSATNAGGSDTQTLVLTVAMSAPVITSTSTASGQVGVAFSYQITATNSPTSFNATGLPAGLTINTATGLISGTPTTAATANITLSATNVGGTDTQALTLTIKPAKPVITSLTTAKGKTGAAFSYQMTASNVPTSFGATGLPAGLTINGTTGLISGTPTAAGASTVSLSATNAGGTGTATLTLTINSACDLNSDNLINVSDAQLAVNQGLGMTACTDDINKDGVCNILDIQRIAVAALGGACVVGP